MSTDQSKRNFVLNKLVQIGSRSPQKYVEMLLRTPDHRVIENLDPWFFMSDSDRSADYCSKALGRAVLPFAQAVEEDMLACFETQPSPNPAVVVINPWAQDEGEWVKSDVEIARLPDYDAWLVYAKKISDNIREREREGDEGGGES